MQAVKPPSKPEMAAAKPPPVPRPSANMTAAKPPPVPPAASPKPALEEEHPALGEMMTFSKGIASISWELPEDKPAPPPKLDPPPRAPSIAELDLPDLDLTGISGPSAVGSSGAPGPTDIVAAPEDDLEFGLDLPTGPAGTKVMAAPQVPPPPGFGGGPGRTSILQAPVVAAPGASLGASPGAPAVAPLGDSNEFGGFGGSFGPSDLVPGPLEEGPQDTFGEFDLATSFTPERFEQGSAINTSAQTPLLIDVTPLSLGVETVGGYVDVLIPANSPVPCEKTRTFMTASDNQTSVTVRVAQGESSKFGGNTRLGDVELSGLRPAQRGEVKISVTFELDADGILNVRARDPDTGRETAATMRLVGATNEVADLDAMSARQARHHVQ